MNVFPLSFEQRIHCPSISALTLLNFSLLSLIVNTSLEVRDRFDPSANPMGTTTGGSVSSNNWKEPKSLNCAFAQSLYQSTFFTAFFEPATHCIIVRSRSESVNCRPGFNRTIMGT